jgi:hypothetical protein
VGCPTSQEVKQGSTIGLKPLLHRPIEFIQRSAGHGGQHSDKRFGTITQQGLPSRPELMSAYPVKPGNRRGASVRQACQFTLNMQVRLVPVQYAFSIIVVSTNDLRRIDQDLLFQVRGLFRTGFPFRILVVVPVRGTGHCGDRNHQ